MQPHEPITLLVRARELYCIHDALLQRYVYCGGSNMAELPYDCRSRDMKYQHTVVHTTGLFFNL